MQEMLGKFSAISLLRSLLSSPRAKGMMARRKERIERIEEGDGGVELMTGFLGGIFKDVELVGYLEVQLYSLKTLFCVK